jgi:hypothetical protein
VDQGAALKGYGERCDLVANAVMAFITSLTRIDLEKLQTDAAGLKECKGFFDRLIVEVRLMILSVWRALVLRFGRQLAALRNCLVGNGRAE